MTRFIWRSQIAAACLVLGLTAVSAGADDSNTTAAVAPTAEAAAPAESAAPAETAPTLETVPPGTPDPNSATNAPEPVIAPQPVPQVVADPSLPPTGIGFQPGAPLRQAFAARNNAPLFFPRYDGEPSNRRLLVPGARLAAAVSNGGEHSGLLAAQFSDSPAPEVAGQPLQPTIAPVGSDAAAPVEGSAEPLSAPLAECGAAPSASWYGGADYLLVRPHQTYDSAYEISPNGASGPSVQNVNFNPSFGNAVRLFAGYETSCDESLRFSYTYMFNDAIRSAAVPTGASILSPLGATLFPGDSIVATEHLLLNAWDLEDVRKLNFAWCNCAGNCMGCPRWDISWSWGVRTIQLDESILNSASGPDAGEFTQKSSFVGAGPRLGIDIHRQIGHSRMSAYVAADAALLIGEQRTTGTNTPSGSNGVQALPNFDVQLGLSWQPTCHLTVTTGYLFETFGDATQLSEASSLALLAPPQASSLSYDGFFFRGEFNY